MRERSFGGICCFGFFLFTLFLKLQVYNGIYTPEWAESVLSITESYMNARFITVFIGNLCKCINIIFEALLVLK